MSIVVNNQVVNFTIRGGCVDDLFHILASNGYPVQMCSTDNPDVFMVSVVVNTQQGGKTE